MKRLHRLYFGLNNKAGVIPVHEFNSFLRRSVVPRFRGFTLFSAVGYWDGQPESSNVLEVATDGNAADSLAVDNIAREYAAQFGQDSVLVVESDITSGRLVEAPAKVSTAA